MNAYRFNVFGKIIAIRHEGDGWKAYSVGNDGKRSPAGFEIPHFISSSELEQYLFDLFHENATSNNNEVRRIG